MSCSVPPCPSVPWSSTQPLSRLLADWVEVRTPVFREEIADADNVVRRYAIFALTSRSEKGVVQR